MIRSLRWVLGSVSLLSELLAPLLAAPNPMLIGMTGAVAALEPRQVLVDLARDQVTATEPFPEYPRRQAMIDELASALAGPLTEGHLNRLIIATNLAVHDMLAPCRASIITDIGHAQSKFIEELYFGQAPVGERPFLREFSATQMFRHHIEQECRKRSEGHKDLGPLQLTASAPM
jgi:hypothetical protein